jgi:RNA polymerase sigma factor (sigma-70 family)
VSIDDPADIPESDGSSRDERLFAAHYLPVMRLCLRRLGDVDDAEDAVQEVFRRAVQHAADLRDDPLPWLITVAKHICLDELRRRRAGQTALERTAAMAAGTEPDPADTAANPERVVVGHMFVRELLGRLTPAERRVMAARVYQSDSSADTAELLGVSSSTTRVLLARARQKLRAYLEEGQIALAGVPLLVTRSLHGMRRRLLERPWDAGGNMAFALPAALVFTMATAPAIATPPGAPRVPVAVAAQPWASISVSGDPALRAAAVREATGEAAIAQRATKGRPASASSPPANSLLLFPPADAHQVLPTDVEPSPNYAQDHTLFMLGTDGCQPPPCSHLFQSTDGGATWSQLPGIGLDATTLVLPANAYAQGHFYANGVSGLQMTADGGKHFVTIAPMAAFVAAAPATSDFNVVISNQAVWRLQSVAPVLVSTFGDPYAEAGGQAVFVHAPGGDEMLQPVVLNPLYGSPPSEIMRCSPLCGNPVQLPFSTGGIQITASPDEAVDHTIFVASTGFALGVSHDDGRSFTAVAQLALQRLVAIPGLSGPRLVSLMGGSYPARLEVSDDGGRTWTLAGIDPRLGATDVLTVTSVPGNGLIAAIQRRYDGNRYIDFVCSSDGMAWSSCSSSAGA